MRNYQRSRNSEVRTRNELCSKVTVAFCLSLWISIAAQLAHAVMPDPGAPVPWLDYWTLNDTNNWTTARGYTAASFTNIATCELGDYWTAIVDDTNAPAWLNYNITEADGTNHFRVENGSVMFWFAPNWSGTNEGGTGPGEWSRLIEVGAYTTNASYGWWSLYTDPDGVNLFFLRKLMTGSGPLTFRLS